MAIIDLDSLEGGNRPEILFGLVAPVGAPLGSFTSVLEDLLEERGYRVETIHVSEFLLEGLNLPTPAPPAGADEYTRINTLMSRGDELRQLAGGSEALALLTAAHINNQRPTAKAGQMPDRAFVVRQLKHPHEVQWLRRIYGNAFQLIGLYCQRDERLRHLVAVRRMSDDQARALIARDEEEAAKFGQQLRSTFHLSDVFVEQRSDGDISNAEDQLRRFLNLLFGRGVITPSKDEYGMYLAGAAALRSADLSRQVGAAILSREGEVLSVGVNEVPRAGGGQYWGEPDDRRDYVLGYDSNDFLKRETLREVAAHVVPDWSALSAEEQSSKLEELVARLDSARVMNLTEFGRAVHAEMEAITSAARVGVSVRGATLYTTTFPCHNCAKHIIGAGISRVVYIEPYPKSLATQLHEDSISLEESGAVEGGKVRFAPFVGVPPRRYARLFSMETEHGRRFKRKDEEGKALTSPLGARMRGAALSYVERENVAAIEAKKFGTLSQKGEKQYNE